MKLHTPAHKHVGDAGKPGQIVNAPTTGRMVSSTPNIQQIPRNTQAVRMFRDLMYQHGVSPFNPAQKQAKTHG